MTTFVEEIAIRGFKSFNNKSNISLTNKLNCIVGPNGSGKSNILDAFCFVLGRLSTKSIRAENYSDLLHKKSGKSVPEGEVSIIFDNSASIFPLESKKIRVDRKITSSGISHYFINRRRATRHQVLELLSFAKVLPEGHNIILQGDISNFISLSSIDKRKLVEEVAGIHIYESKKESALHELFKVEEKLKEAKIVITEKRANLNSLESEKNVAEKYRDYVKERDSAKSTELNLRKNSLDKKNKEIILKIAVLENKQKKMQAFIDHSEKKIQFLKDKIEMIEDQIEKKGGDEQLEIQKEIDSFKSQISSSENLVISSKNEIYRINTRIENLQDKQSDIELTLSEKEKEIKKLSQEKNELVSKITKLNSISRGSKDSHAILEKEVEKLEKYIEELKDKKLSFQKEIQELKSEKEVSEYKLKDVNSKIQLYDNQSKKDSETKNYKARYKELIQKINSLASKDAEFAIKLSELRKDVSKKEDELAKKRLDENETQDLLLRDRAISTVMSAKKNISGIIGTISELGGSNKKYSKALSILAGYRMKNIVVDNSETAIKCLKLLKETQAGFSTFLPMDKIKVKSISPEVLSKKNQSGVFGLAYELISCDPKYTKIFQHIFRDTLVVLDTETAKKIGVSKFNMITLDGDLFSTSGAITGGYRKDNVFKFSDKSYSKEIEVLMSEVSSFRKKLKTDEENRRSLEESIFSLRSEKAELEGKISSISDLNLDINELTKQKAALNNKFKSIENSIEKFTKEIQNIDEIVTKKTVEKNASSMRLRDFKFGEKSIELRNFESQMYSIESKIASLKATLENVLFPEKENITKVVKSLEKEKQDFKDQIKNQEESLKETNKKLNLLQKTESEFYGQLKKLFDQKKEFQESVKKEESDLKQNTEIKVQDNEEINIISIANARVESELEALNEEIKSYTNALINEEFKTVLSAKKRFEELEEKIISFGNVNMKALEIYEKVKEEFDSLSWKVDKLSEEKESIHSVIQEIEKKKYITFMDTFKKLNENFKKIFGRISNNMFAELILESKENPLDGGMNIHVTDNSNKKLYLASLSGGQKTLVALSFIFAIQEFEPAPFYLLDEIDAALDKVNSKKVSELLKEYSEKTQVLVISHNDEIISSSESIYGVWMNKAGESTVNSLKI